MFLDVLARSYGAGMQKVDYQKAYEAARRTINDWVASRTKDRIRDLIAQGVLDEQTRLVLTNAIYLKAAARRSPTVQATGTRRCACHTPGVSRWTVVVPDMGDLDGFERALDGAMLRRIVSGLDTSTHVRLSVPKFSFRSQAQLKDALSELGMPIAFTDRADLSGITKQAPLEIADVIRHAFIAVDEKGTEAAAATVVVTRQTSAPPRQVELKIDRPFLFLIEDDETGAILFMGRLTDPRV